MSEACLLVSRTAQNKINLKKLEYILKNCHRHHHNLSYSHCLLVNFGIFKLALNFLFAFKGSKCLLWIKRRFESHNAQGNISRQYENFKIYEDLYGKSVKCDWMAKVFRLLQILLTFGGRYNRYIWDIRLKMYRLINFNMFSQLVLKKFTKAICFRFYQKLITCWSRDQLMQKRPITIKTIITITIIIINIITCTTNIMSHLLLVDLLVKFSQRFFAWEFGRNFGLIFYEQLF